MRMIQMFILNLFHQLKQMYKNFSYSNFNISPIIFKYALDNSLTIKQELITFNDGFTVCAEPILYALKDLVFNRNSLIFLTSAVQLNNIFDITQNDISLAKLENKIGLI